MEETLRSRWSQYSYLDMTALDLAREFQASELYELLTPAVCYTIPHATLDKLESHFHHLITDSLGDRVKEEKLYLPVLEPLTEFESQPVWFPVAYGENYEVQEVVVCTAEDEKTNRFVGFCLSARR